MATRISPPQNKTYYINPAYLTFVENSGYGANLIQVSASSSCYISVYDPANGIGYSDADRNYKRWKVTAYNNKFPDEDYDAWKIYVRLDKNGTSALVIYDKVERGVHGGEIVEEVYELGNVIKTEGPYDKEHPYYFIRIGDVSATDGTSIREITYDTGYLLSDQGAEESNTLNEMWQWDKYSFVNWLIEAKAWLASFTVKGFISLVGGLIFKKGDLEKVIEDVKRSDDDENEFLLDEDGNIEVDEDGYPVPNPDYIPNGDNVLPTAKYVQDSTEKKFLRKDQDDRSVGKISSDKGFEAGEFVQEATGAACYQDKDGNWHIETDHLRVRKKAVFTEIEVQEVYHVGGQMLLTAASMIVDYVFEMEDRYRCYFAKKDSDGREVENLWRTGDQAYCNTFNMTQQSDGTLGNHYLWRLVIGTNDKVTLVDEPTRTFGDVTIQTSDYNYVDLSKVEGEFDSMSDAPKADDEIVQLGYQGSDLSRQNAIMIAGAGAGSPYIYEFTGIGLPPYPFSLPEPETRIKPGDNMFTGIMRIQGGSTGAGNLVDLNIGAVNLLLNSGFTGDYKAEDLDDSYRLKMGTELFSRGMKHWAGTATINDDEEAVSGKSAYIGKLSQSVPLFKGENYVVSFKAKGISLKVSLGGETITQELTSEYTHYFLKFTSDGIDSFVISGDATICDLQLERGIVATDWNPSPDDNDKALAEFQAVKYLQDAIEEGSTTVNGGLILSSIIKLGNYKDKVMQKVNAGMSGIYNDDDDVAFWGGGTFEQAIATVIKFKQNPNYRPTDAEWKDLANFVVSHGGDLFMRGYVHALGGYFRGEVHAESGIFKNVKSPNGSFTIDKDGNVNIVGMFETAVDGNRIVIDAEQKKLSLYDKLGRETTVLNFYENVGESETYGTIRLVKYDKDSTDIVNECEIRPKNILMVDYLGKCESVYTPSNVSFTTFDGKQGELLLGLRRIVNDWATGDYSWRSHLLLKDLATSASAAGVNGVYNDNGTLKINQEGSRVPDEDEGDSDSGSGGRSSGGTTSGLSQTVLIDSDSGTHSLTFNNGLTTNYNFTERVVGEDEVIKTLKVKELPANPDPNTMYVIIA